MSRVTQDKKLSKYWGVTFMSRLNGKTPEKPWRTHILTRNGHISKCFATEREAAIHADTINLELNLGKPLNILKPKL
jgi:hypothetical protein